MKWHSVRHLIDAVLWVAPGVIKASSPKPAPALIRATSVKFPSSNEDSDEEEVDDEGVDGCFGACPEDGMNFES